MEKIVCYNKCFVLELQQDIMAVENLILETAGNMAVTRETARVDKLEVEQLAEMSRMEQCDQDKTTNLWIYWWV